MDNHNKDGIVSASVGPRKHPHRLSRAAVSLNGDFSQYIANEILYAAFDLDARALDDKQNPYLLTIGFIETAANIAEVNAMAQRDYVPESITFTTRNQTNSIVSIRTFSNLKFRSSAVGYAVHANDERPVHKIIYTATLVDSQYFPSE